MKLLAIGAHPDDIEIFMFGFIAACKERGDKIFLTIATDGALGTVSINENLKETRKKEALKGLRNLGKPIFLDLPDGALSFSNYAPQIIHEHIKSINPDLVITHDPNDYHPDHRSLSKYVKDAIGFSCPIIYAETLMGINFLPDFYVDITKFFHHKIHAIKAHKSQQPEKFIKATKLMNRYRSAQCNAPDENYAEAFRADIRFPFADLRILIPPPPNISEFYRFNSQSFI